MKIVFAHFGSDIPKHLRLNLIRMNRLFPEQKIVLLVDKHCKVSLDFNIEIVEIQQNSTWLNIESRLQHPRNFRKNFWFSSLIRLVEIANYSVQINEPLLHIESDVIVSPDFPMTEFMHLDAYFALPRFNTDLAVASTLFIRNSVAGQFLMDLCIDSVNLDSSTTDMHILGKLFSSVPAMCLELESGQFVQHDKKIFVTPGIFDGLEIGQYLFGEDSRNNRGFRLVRKRNPYGVLDVSKMRFAMNTNRDFPDYLTEKNERLPIFSLHVHSKRLEMFNSKFPVRYVKYVEESGKSTVSELELRILIRAMLGWMSRRFARCFSASK